MIRRIATWGGIGDVLLTTPALRSIKEADPDCSLHVYCVAAIHYEVLQHNPNVDVLKLSSVARNIWMTQANAARYVLGRHAQQSSVARLLTRLLPRFDAPAYAACAPMYSRMHASEIIGQLLGVRVQNRRLEIHLTTSEEAAGRAVMAQFKNPVVIQVTSLASRNQNWPVSKWEALVRNNPSYTFVQFGTSNETRIAGAVDLCGTTKIREAIAALKYAGCFIGVVSSFSHATNAVDTPGVVLWGPSAPRVWSHPNNVVISRNLRCSPCIDAVMDRSCPYGAACIQDIDVETVEAALYAQFRRPLREGNGH